jgi:HSCB C-terminal oligomerisation domain
VLGMANSATTKAARIAARRVVNAAQEELARRQRANVDDLAKFMSARERIEEIERWETERIAAVRTQVSQRRAAQESQCAAALRAMRDRGEDLAEIARLAGIDQKAVRELVKIKAADEKPEPPATDGKKPEPDPASDGGSNDQR